MINVNLVRWLEGPRHARLHLLHEVVAEALPDAMRLCWFRHTGGIGHARALQLMWEAELQRPERYAVFTEHDFLPNLGRWLDTRMLDDEHPVVSCRYVTRNPVTRKLDRFDTIGPWYTLVDKAAVQRLHWEEWGQHNDPANGMKHFLEQEYPGRSVRILEPVDDMPASYGVQYPTGTHLFWSRHYHDPPHIRVAGVCLGDMQAKVDQAVTHWLDRAHAAVQRVAAKRGLK